MTHINELIYLAHARYILIPCAGAEDVKGRLGRKEEKKAFLFLISGFPMEARVIRLERLDQLENSILIHSHLTTQYVVNQYPDECL